ncbi:MAG TPA: hypothetical protein VGN00_29660 [Puia sp.]|jgi:hypothetical protein
MLSAEINVQYIGAATAILEIASCAPAKPVALGAGLSCAVNRSLSPAAAPPREA